MEDIDIDVADADVVDAQNVQTVLGDFDVELQYLHLHLFSWMSWKCQKQVCIFVV